MTILYINCVNVLEKFHLYEKFTSQDKDLDISPFIIHKIKNYENELRTFFTAIVRLRETIITTFIKINNAYEDTDIDDITLYLAKTLQYTALPKRFSTDLSHSMIPIPTHDKDGTIKQSQAKQVKITTLALPGTAVTTIPKANPAQSRSTAIVASGGGGGGGDGGDDSDDDSDPGAIDPDNLPGGNNNNNGQNNNNPPNGNNNNQYPNGNNNQNNTNQNGNANNNNNRTGNNQNNGNNQNTGNTTNARNTHNNQNAYDDLEYKRTKLLMNTAMATYPCQPRKNTQFSGENMSNERQSELATKYIALIQDWHRIHLRNLSEEQLFTYAISVTFTGKALKKMYLNAELSTTRAIIDITDIPSMLKWFSREYEDPNLWKDHRKDIINYKFNKYIDPAHCTQFFDDYDIKVIDYHRRIKNAPFIPDEERAKHMITEAEMYSRVEDFIPSFVRAAFTSGAHPMPTTYQGYKTLFAKLQDREIRMAYKFSTDKAKSKVSNHLADVNLVENEAKVEAISATIPNKPASVVKRDNNRYSRNNRGRSYSRNGNYNRSRSYSRGRSFNRNRSNSNGRGRFSSRSSNRSNRYQSRSRTPTRRSNSRSYKGSTRLPRKPRCFRCNSTTHLIKDCKADSRSVNRFHKGNKRRFNRYQQAIKRNRNFKRRPAFIKEINQIKSRYFKSHNSKQRSYKNGSSKHTSAKSRKSINSIDSQLNDPDYDSDHSINQIDSDSFWDDSSAGDAEVMNIMTLDYGANTHNSELGSISVGTSHVDDSAVGNYLYDSDSNSQVNIQAIELVSPHSSFNLSISNSISNPSNTSTETFVTVASMTDNKPAPMDVDHSEDHSIAPTTIMSSHTSVTLQMSPHSSIGDPIKSEASGSPNYYDSGTSTASDHYQSSTNTNLSFFHSIKMESSVPPSMKHETTVKQESHLISNAPKTEVSAPNPPANAPLPAVSFNGNSNSSMSNANMPLAPEFGPFHYNDPASGQMIPFMVRDISDPRIPLSGPVHTRYVQSNDPYVHGHGLRSTAYRDEKEKDKPKNLVRILAPKQLMTLTEENLKSFNDDIKKSIKLEPQQQQKSLFKKTEVSVSPSSGTEDAAAMKAHPRL